MPVNHLRFINEMMKKYTWEYDLPTDLIASIVEEVLLLAPDSYFTFNMVQDHPEMCKQCGQCCSTINCKYFNGKTCDEYATRYDACAEWPYYEVNSGDFDAGLMLDPDCALAIGLAQMQIEKRLNEYSDLNDM